MSASQPLSLVTDHGTLTSANATTAVTGAKTVQSGVLYVVCSDEKKAGNIVACNTATQAGVGSFHIAKGDSFLYRYGHPARGTVTAASKANPCVLTLNHPDSKIRVGDYVTMSGAAVGAWNTLIAHVPVTAVSSPQQWNDYAQTVTVTANSSALADFTGTAFIEKSVIFRLAPETSDGCTLHISEVGIA